MSRFSFAYCPNCGRLNIYGARCTCDPSDIAEAAHSLTPTANPSAAVTFTLTPPDDFLNINENLHWAVKGPRVKAWRTAGCAAVRAGFNPYHFERAHITVAIRFKNNIVRDVGNFYPTAKAIVDGCVDAKLLANDDDLHITGPDMRRVYPNGDPEVTVTIEELL